MKKKHWYFLTHHICYECCDIHKTYRERRYGKKPKNRDKQRVFYREHCGCISDGF